MPATGSDTAQAAVREHTSGFEEMAQAARPALLRAAQAVTGRREDAEDAVQTSLLKAMNAWPRVADQEHWRQQAYVRQIVVNTCRSGWRKWGSRVSVGEMPEIAQGAGTDTVDEREMMRDALARLPQRQREVLLLRYYHDLPEAEIADALGCAPGTVKSSAARALKALRDILDQEAPEEAASRLARAGQEAPRRAGASLRVVPALPQPLPLVLAVEQAPLAPVGGDEEAARSA